MTLSVAIQNPADAKAKAGAKVDLPSEIFDVPTNIALIHQVVVAQLASARQGTHSTKTRGEVRGGGRKPYRQKGTGRARQGSTRAPQFAGGGVVHGPQPRNYDQRTPKKMKAAALRGALSDRARNDRLFVVSSLVSGDEPSTKAASATLAKVSTARHVLVVAERTDDVTWLSLRNVPAVHLLEPGQLNTYDVLISDDVVFTQGALEEFLGGPATGKSVKGAASSTEADAQIDDDLIKIEDPGPVGTPEEKPAPKKRAAPSLEKAETPAKKTAAKPAAKKSAAKKTAAEPAAEAAAKPAKKAAAKPAAKPAAKKAAAKKVADTPAKQSDEEDS
jgi:large subunit ribosomal protein L4